MAEHVRHPLLRETEDCERRHRVRGYSLEFDVVLDIQASGSILIDQQRNIGKQWQRRVTVIFEGSSVSFQFSQESDDLTNRVETFPANDLGPFECLSSALWVIQQRAPRPGDMKNRHRQRVSDDIVHLAGDSCALFGRRVHSLSLCRFMKFGEQPLLTAQQQTGK